MYRHAVAVSAACLLASSFPSPASANTLAVDATFGSSIVEQSCDASGCTISSTSLTCAAYGVRGTVPYAEGCVAHISVAVDRMPLAPLGPRGQIACMYGRGSVTVSTTSGTTISMPVTTQFGHGVSAWYGDPSLPTLDLVTVIEATGTLGVTCNPLESAPGEFTGTLTYLAP